MVMNYGVMYAYFVDKNSGQFKAPFNQIFNEARVFTPKDTAIVTPNRDTPYSFLGADLRAEPLVLCVPKVEKSRYYVVQLIDMYTFNYGYIGSRSTGNDAGCYMIAGPDCKGDTPAGIKKASAGLFISMARSKPSFRKETVLTRCSTFTREGEAQRARVLDSSGFLGHGSVKISTDTLSAANWQFRQFLFLSPAASVNREISGEHRGAKIFEILAASRASDSLAARGTIDNADVRALSEKRDCEAGRKK